MPFDGDLCLRWVASHGTRVVKIPRAFFTSSEGLAFLATPGEQGMYFMIRMAYLGCCSSLQGSGCAGHAGCTRRNCARRASRRRTSGLHAGSCMPPGLRGAEHWKGVPWPPSARCAPSDTALSARLWTLISGCIRWDFHLAAHVNVLLLQAVICAFLRLASVLAARDEYKHMPLNFNRRWIVCT